MALSVMPRNVVLFERIGYATVVFGSAASMWANWPTILRFGDQYPVLYPMVTAVTVAVQLGWIWMIARKRQSWARWPSVVVTLGSILTAIFTAKAQFALNPAAEIVKDVIYLMWVIEFSLLFTKEAKEWFVFPPSPQAPSDPAAAAES